MNNTITAIIANGIASSYCNQVKPPPLRNATNAGIEIKLMALDCVAIVDIPTAHHGRLRPPR